MFDVYEVAKTAVREMRGVVETVQVSDRDLARQMRRAGASVMLNIA